MQMFPCCFMSYTSQHVQCNGIGLAFYMFLQSVLATLAEHLREVFLIISDTRLDLRISTQHKKRSRI